MTVPTSATSSAAAPLDLLKLAEVVLARFVVIAAVGPIVAKPLVGWREGVLELVLPAALTNAALAWVEYRHPSRDRGALGLAAWWLAGWALAVWALTAGVIPGVLWDGGGAAEVAATLEGWSTMDALVRLTIAGVIATAFAIALAEESRRADRSQARDPVEPVVLVNALLIGAGVLGGAAAATVFEWPGTRDEVLRVTIAQVVFLPIGGALSIVHRWIDSSVVVIEAVEVRHP